MEQTYQELFDEIESYAQNHHLDFCRMALHFICDFAEKYPQTEAAKKRVGSELLHCMRMCWLLIDLDPDITLQEEDNLLSAVLLHIFPENISLEDLEDWLVNDPGYDPMVYELIDILSNEVGQFAYEQHAYYEKIQQNPLALLAALADRGDLMQQIYLYTTWNAHRYIDESKAFYFPMSIYGKEHYHRLLAPIHVLTEKIKSLIEVSEILLRRYEIREADLMADILALKEENATIKGIIEKFRTET